MAERNSMGVQANGTWVQTEREAHELFAKLIAKSPKAAALMHLIVARVGSHNAVVISQPTLAKMLDCHINTVAKSVKLLQEQNWIEVRRIGGSGTTNAYIVNDRVAWSGKRDGIRYSLFSANVVISDTEQPDAIKLGQQAKLRTLPKIGEGQLPSGPGLPPPSEPSLPGMEPDLPSTRQETGSSSSKDHKKIFRLMDGEALIQQDGRTVIVRTESKYIGDDPDTGEPILVPENVEFIELTPEAIRERLTEIKNV